MLESGAIRIAFTQTGNYESPHNTQSITWLGHLHDYIYGQQLAKSIINSMDYNFKLKNSHITHRKSHKHKDTQNFHKFSPTQILLHPEQT